MHLALEAVDAGLALRPDGDLRALRGLILADLGQGADALAALDAAASGATGALAARVEINRALVRLDQGDPDGAEAALARAEPLAAGDPGLLARIAADRAVVASLRGGPAGGDALGKIGDQLARGDLAGARASIPAARDARSEVQRSLAEGTIARAEGRFADAGRHLNAAAEAAGAHGLVREQAAALAQLGVTFGADNRWDAGAAALDRALDLVAGTSFRVLERSVRVEAARAAAHTGASRRAQDQLAAARALRVTDRAGDGGLAEVEGVVAAFGGDRAAARAAYTRATAAYLARGAYADAARVGTLAVELDAADPSALAAAKQSALDAFAKAGDPLGPVHVGIAQGLGQATAGDLDGALRTFASASAAAEKVGGPRGAALARIARENAARALADLADSETVLAQADQWGLGELVKRAEAYERARGAYDAALAAYEAGRYPEAVTGFDQATRELEALGEAGYARVARRARAWARFNASTRLAPAAAHPVYQQLVEEGVAVQDGELRVRSMGAAALAAVALGRPEVAVSLRAAAREAEAAGLRPLAGQCWAALVEVEPAVADKVSAARRAFALRDADRTGAYALYSAAVAAYDAEDYALAESLAAEVLPHAGELAPSVREVLDAAGASR